MNGEKYLIFCGAGGVADLALWWGPNRSGYTTNFETAGRYSEQEAQRLENWQRPDIAVPESMAREAAIKVVPFESPIVAFINERRAALKPAPTV